MGMANTFANTGTRIPIGNWSLWWLTVGKSTIIIFDEWMWDAMRMLENDFFPFISQETTGLHIEWANVWCVNIHRSRPLRRKEKKKKEMNDDKSTRINWKCGNWNDNNNSRHHRQVRNTHRLSRKNVFVHVRQSLVRTNNSLDSVCE